MTIEGIERPACGMEPETALAFMANDDPGGLVVCIDRISFGHGYALRRRMGRRPLAVMFGWIGFGSDQQQQQQATIARSRPRQGSKRVSNRVIERVMGAPPFKPESTKTPRGTLAFDVAAQVACRNHRGAARRPDGDMTTLRAEPHKPNQLFLQ